MNQPTQHKPRIRCHHYQPKNPQVSGLLAVKATDDNSLMAFHICDWDYICKVASQALDLDQQGRFHPRRIVQAAITTN